MLAIPQPSCLGTLCFLIPGAVGWAAAQKNSWPAGEGGIGEAGSGAMVSGAARNLACSVLGME